MTGRVRRQGEGSKDGASVALFTPDGLLRTPSYEHIARAGDFAFVAGQVARDQNGALIGPHDAAEQAKHIYDNIGRILEALAAAPDQVVKITTLLTDRGDSAAVAAERHRFFGNHRPPHTGMIVAGLGGPEVRVEVEIVVYCPRSSS